MVAPPSDLEKRPAPGRMGPLLRLYPSLGLPAFRLIWLGTLQSMIAWQMSVVACGYAALVLSGSATTLGLVSTAAGLPLLLSPIGGVAADRFPSRLILLLSQALMGLGAVALAILALAGVLQVWHLIALAGIQGLAFAFNAPARQAYLGKVVPPRIMRNAIATNNAATNFCRVAGPALAGALLAIPGVGIPGVFIVMSVLYLGVQLTLVRLPSDTPDPSRHVGGGLDQFKEGIQYIGGSPPLKALVLVSLIVALLGLPYLQLLPLLSERVFQVGPGGLGALTAASGLGALLGSLVIAAISEFPRPAGLQLGLGVGLGLALILVAVSPAFAVVLVALLLAGVGSAAFTSLNNTLMMSNSELRMYGRVMSVYVLTFALTPFGTLPLAWLAEQAGARLMFGLAGAITAGAILAVAALYPAYRKIR